MEEIERSKDRDLADEIARLIEERQYRALKQLNTGTIELYWAIGKIICYRQEAEGWGKAVVESLADELQKKFPGAKGYSAVNLWRMRNFYVTYSGNEKLSPLVTEISWSCNLVIMNKCKDDLEREFYLRRRRPSSPRSLGAGETPRGPCLIPG